MRTAIAIALCLTALAGAEDKPEPAKEMSPKERKVRRLLELKGPSDMGKQMLDRMVDQFEGKPGLPKGFTDKLKELADMKNLAEQMVPIYLKHYEEADLDAAIAFYETPAGKHELQCQGAVQMESMEMAQKWAQALVDKAMAAYGAEEVKNKGVVENPGAQSAAEKMLKTIVDAESNFMKADYDNDGKDFCYNLNLLYNQVDAAGNQLMLIPKKASEGSWKGFRLAAVPTYDAAGGDDCKFGFAYSAVPETYGKDGKFTYLVNHTGAIWFKDTGGKPPAAWPKDPEKEGWQLLGE